MATLTADDFIRHITDPLIQDLDVLATNEAERLSTYFAALERRLTQTAPAADLSRKGTLTGLFTKVAADTRNLVLSDFTLIPSDFIALPAYKDLQEKGGIRSYFKSVFRYPNDPTRMGFIQVLGPDDDAGTISIPVLTLDAALLKELEDFDLHLMTTALQKLVSLGNHDMMHHLTNTFLNSNVAQAARTPDYAMDMQDFMASRVTGADAEPESYESWAILSHAATWNEACRDGAAAELDQISETIFTALATLDRAMELAGKPLHLRARTMDYFSSLTCHGLMRLCPFDAPVMERAFESATALTLEADYSYAAFVKNRLKTSLPPLQQDLRSGFLKAFSRYLDEPEMILTRFPQDVTVLMAHYNEIAIRQDFDPLDIDDLQLYTMAKQGPSYWTQDRLSDIHDTIRSFGKIFQNGSLIDSDASCSMMSDVIELEKSITAKTARFFCLDPVLRADNRGLIHDTANHIASQLYQRVRRLTDGEDPWKKIPLFIETLANYTQNGQSYLPAEGEALSLIDARRLALISVAPDIAYLLSPADHNDRLKHLRLRTQAIDHGIIAILDNRTMP